MPPENPSLEPSKKVEPKPSEQLPANKLNTPEVLKSDLEVARDHFNQAKLDLGTLLTNLDVNKKVFKKEYKEACLKLAEKFTTKEIEQLLTESKTLGDKHVDYRALNHVTKVDEKVTSEPDAPPIRFYFRLKETPAPAHFEGTVKKGEKIEMDKD